MTIPLLALAAPPPRLLVARLDGLTVRLVAMDADGRHGRILHSHPLGFEPSLSLAAVQHNALDDASDSFLVWSEHRIVNGLGLYPNAVAFFRHFLEIQEAWMAVNVRNLLSASQEAHDACDPSRCQDVTTVGRSF